MEHRICKFCNEPASYAPIDRMDRAGIKIFFCYPCQAEYLYFTREGKIKENPASSSLYSTINDKMYRWTITADNGGHLWRVRKPGIPGEKINEDMQHIMFIEETETIMVTPQNIEVKIRSWLPFL